MTEVVAAIIVKDGKILACRRPPHKKRGLLWEFPGGKREKGEDLVGALKRECMEELGVEIAVGGLFAETKYVYEDLSVHLYFFKAEIMRGETLEMIYGIPMGILPHPAGAAPVSFVY